MFGYIIVNKAEMKFKEFDEYHSFYCGICRDLKRKYGSAGQLSLSYDMTFLAILLTGLYEPETMESKCKCIAHPFESHPTKNNIFTEYAADMNIILTYYKLLDDWKDENKVVSLTGLHAYRKTFLKLKEKYPEKCEVIRKCLAQLQKCEERGEENIDVTAGYFGKLMAELFVYKHDMWENTLRKMGFYLGKFIYIMDAYDDGDDDIKEDNYNALLPLYIEENFEERCRDMMNLVLAECTNEFEKLPCVEDVEILRNILYAGVWDKYDKKRMEENG